jgi:hypothetical protein
MLAHNRLNLNQRNPCLDNQLHSHLLGCSDKVQPLVDCLVNPLHLSRPRVFLVHNLPHLNHPQDYLDNQQQLSHPRHYLDNQLQLNHLRDYLDNQLQLNHLRDYLDSQLQLNHPLESLDSQLQLNHPRDYLDSQLHRNPCLDKLQQHQQRRHLDLDRVHHRRDPSSFQAVPTRDDRFSF